ncbi:hypothetical protein VTJ49DRAFT_6848 [Mycothermus thermophilus]|uniref:Phospholipid-binding protein n=1 Tax=Humicola insolens TaxID=85995 RepID=A0ABR3VQ30_HUMIN
MAANSPPSPTSSQLPPLPGSPTYSYASTANPSLSQYNLPLPPPPRPAHAVLTKADLENSQAAYSDLLASAKSYRLALSNLATAASSFGAALEACARLKEARADALGPPQGGSLSNSFTAHQATCTADTLLTVAGLQHLVANHQHILSETVYRAFEVPLLHELDKWRAAVEDEEEGYARAVAEQSKEIRRLEKEGLKLHRQRRRDVARFRSHLVELTAKLDGLTVRHAEHARTLLRESQDTSARIVDASCSLARAEVDIFESLARKGWTGGGLDEVLEKGVDVFAADEADVGGKGGAGIVGGDGPGGVGGSAGGEGAKLFSILPPKSILADASSSGGGGLTRSDSLLGDDADRYQSIDSAVTATGATADPVKDRDAESIFSFDGHGHNRSNSRARNVRPFSPQPLPIRLNPEDLLGGLEHGAGDVVETSSDAGRGGRTDDEEEDDDEQHPWRNEGLRRRGTPSDDESSKGTIRLGAGLGDDHSRQESWGEASGAT